MWKECQVYISRVCVSKSEVPATGCQPSCLSLATDQLTLPGSCKDQPANSAWNETWDTYIPAMQFVVGFLVYVRKAKRIVLRYFCCLIFCFFFGREGAVWRGSKYWSILGVNSLLGCKKKLACCWWRLFDTWYLHFDTALDLLWRSFKQLKFVYILDSCWTSQTLGIWRYQGPDVVRTSAITLIYDMIDAMKANGCKQLQNESMKYMTASTSTWCAGWATKGCDLKNEWCYQKFRLYLIKFP